MKMMDKIYEVFESFGIDRVHVEKGWHPNKDAYQFIWDDFDYNKIFKHTIDRENVMVAEAGSCGYRDFILENLKNSLEIFVKNHKRNK